MTIREALDSAHRPSFTRFAQLAGGGLSAHSDPPEKLPRAFREAIYSLRLQPSLV